MKLTFNHLVFGNFVVVAGIHILVQVNLFQKHLFFHQLTHNMTKDCLLNYKFSTWKLQAQNMLRTCCIHRLFKTETKQNLCTYTTSYELAIIMYWTRNSMNNLSSYFGLVDAKIWTSHKDLPVTLVSRMMRVYVKPNKDFF